MKSKLTNIALGAGMFAMSCGLGCETGQTLKDEYLEGKVTKGCYQGYVLETNHHLKMIKPNYETETFFKIGDKVKIQLRKYQNLEDIRLVYSLARNPGGQQR